MQAAQNFICDPVATRRFGFDNEHVGLHLARGAVGLELKAGVDGSGLQKAYACLAKPAFSGRTCSAEHHREDADQPRCRRGLKGRRRVDKSWEYSRMGWRNCALRKQRFPDANTTHSTTLGRENAGIDGVTPGWVKCLRHPRKSATPGKQFAAPPKKRERPHIVVGHGA